MRVGELGEHELLARIRQELAELERECRAGADSETRSALVAGIGEDCAVVRCAPGAEWLLETDQAVEGVHFRLDWLAPEQVGGRLAVQGLSDIAAMAGWPRYVLVALAVPAAAEAEVVVGIMRGVARRCAQYGALVVGGDLSGSPAGIRATIAVFGEVEPGAAIRRGGAQAGDVLYATGRPGLARAGWLWLGRAGRGRGGLEPAEQRAGLQQALAHFYEPRPRLEEARFLARRAHIHAMIDLSDGLAGDAARLAEASGLAAVLEAEGVLADPSLPALASLLGLSPAELVLAGGDDFELLFAAPAAAVERIRPEFEQRFALPLRRVGRLEPGAGVWWEPAPGGERAPVPARSYEHFRA
ncbi:MAG: thiamine-monophosphate kinase [Planctomycetota bacterium]|nr:MAG: thiamine-monophosphate kinase [Planctomycetota bacterium]